MKSVFFLLIAIGLVLLFPLRLIANIGDEPTKTHEKHDDNGGGGGGLGIRGTGPIPIRHELAMVKTVSEITYEALQKTDFFKFFNVKEISRLVLRNGDLQLKLKTGGFKQYIDIELTLTPAKQLKHAILWSDRKWIGDEFKLNVFARDVVKSFIHQFTCKAGKEKVQDLVASIFDVRGKNDPTPIYRKNPRPIVRSNGLEVFIGTRKYAILRFDGCDLMLENKKVEGTAKLIVEVVFKTPYAREPQKVGNLDLQKTFLTAADMTAWSLKLTQINKEQLFQVWTNLTKEAVINRVVDIRWVFKTEAEALDYHQKNLRKNSENSREVTNPAIKPFGQELRVFHKGSDDPLNKAFGMKMNMFYFIFRTGRILSKIFISGSDQLTLQKALAIARLACLRIEGHR